MILTWSPLDLCSPSRWYERSYRNGLIKLSVTLKKIKSISKGTFKIIQEQEALELKYPGSGASKGVTELKSRFFNPLKKVFKAVRGVCQEMKQISDSVFILEEDSSCISQLPLETFDQLLVESNPSSSQLRGLMTLITLQSSELLRKLLTHLAMSQHSVSKTQMKSHSSGKLTSIVQLSQPATQVDH